MISEIEKSFINDMIGDDVDNLVMKFKSLFKQETQNRLNTTELYFNILSLLHNSL